MTWREHLVSAYYALAKWWHPDWWRYLLRAPEERNWFGWRWYHVVAAYLNAIRCRYRGHPHPVAWYNPGGMEPDMTCQGCGDDLG